MNLCTELNISEQQKEKKKWVWSVKCVFFTTKHKASSLMYLAGFLLLADVLGLLVFLGPLRQVGVVGQAIEQGRHLWARVHLLLLCGKKGGGV